MAPVLGLQGATTLAGTGAHVMLLTAILSRPDRQSHRNMLKAACILPLVLTCSVSCVATRGGGFLDATIPVRESGESVEIGHSSSGPDAPDAPEPFPLRVHLLATDRAAYRRMETLIYDVRLTNVSKTPVELPWSPHPIPRRDRPVSGYRHALIDLSGVSQQGRDYYFDSFVLYGSPTVPEEPEAPGPWRKRRHPRACGAQSDRGWQPARSEPSRGTERAGGRGRLCPGRPTLRRLAFGAFGQWAGDPDRRNRSGASAARTVHGSARGRRRLATSGIPGDRDPTGGVSIGCGPRARAHRAFPERRDGDCCAGQSGFLVQGKQSRPRRAGCRHVSTLRPSPLVSGRSWWRWAGRAAIRFLCL